MKDQIVISKTNGACAVAIPLFRNNFDKYGLDKVGNYVLVLNSENPLAYVIDIGDGNPQVLSVNFIKNHCEIIGDL